MSCVQGNATRVIRVIGKRSRAEEGSGIEGLWSEISPDRQMRDYGKLSRPFECGRAMALIPPSRALARQGWRAMGDRVPESSAPWPQRLVIGAENKTNRLDQSAKSYNFKMTNRIIRDSLASAD